MSRHQSTKHTTYYELLDAVRNATGCPLCDIEASRVKRYFESLLHKSVNDPGVREALAHSRGYCQGHAHYLRCHGNGLGIAILYQVQIRIFLRLLQNLQTVTSKIARKRPAARRMEACPACRMQNECRKRYGSTLIEWTHDQEMRSALDACRGLCIQHFLTVLDMPMDSKARTFLIEMQQARMTSLLHELEEYQRKHDYRLSHEGFGSKSNSWPRAIRMMVGEHDVL